MPNPLSDSQDILAALPTPSRLDCVDGLPESEPFVRKVGQIAVYVNNASLYFEAGDGDDVGDADGAGWEDSSTALNLKIAIEYFDVGTETIRIGYTTDGTTETLATIVTKANTKTWKKAHLARTGVKFGTDYYGLDSSDVVGGGGDHYNADFRIFSSGALYLASVAVTNRDTKAALRFPAFDFQNQTSGVPPESLEGGAFADDIFSDNYVAGSSGWNISRLNGDAEFNDIVARGTIYASAGDIAHWDIGVVDAYTISADSGKIRLNSQTPYISLGASVSAYMTGAGIWMGKDSSLWKFRVGDPSGAYMSWDGTKLIKKGARHKGASELGDSDDGATDTDVMTVYGHMQSDDWVSGVTGTGWRISNAGRAVFRNIVARGSIRSSVFEADVVSAVAGTMVIAKSAGKLDVTMSVPASLTWTMSIEDPPGTGWLFANGDIIRVKETQGSVSETWFTVTRGTQSGGHQTYTCTFQSGTRPASYEKGLGMIDYGQSGQGFLELSADGTGAPYYSVRTHAGSPWTTVTERGRFGNMNGAFGVASDYYGFGVGDYSGGNYLKYDTNGGFVFRAGAGAVGIDASGVSVVRGNTTAGTVNTIGFVTALGGTNVAGIHEIYASGTDENRLNIYSNIDWTGTGTNVTSFGTLFLRTAGSGSSVSALKLAAISTSRRMELAYESGTSFYFDISATPSLLIGNGVSGPGSATLDIRGSAIFNEDGTDSDFRIEGDANANLFFVDASADKIGIGNNAPSVTLDLDGSVLIDGASDAIHLRIQGDASQTANLQTWENSAGTVQAGISSDGRLGVGVAPTAGYSQYVKKFITDQSWTGQAVEMWHRLTASSSAYVLKGMYFQSLHLSDDTTYVGANTASSGVYALQGTAGLAGTKNLTGAQVANFYLTATGGGTLTNGYGVVVGNPLVSGGSVLTNNYAIYVSSQTAGGTLNYALYTNTGLVHFGDSVDLSSGKNVTLVAGNIITDTTTGTKFGTSTSQKLSFYNSTPIVQPGATTDLGTVLSNLGLRASGTAYPITTSGAVVVNGTTPFGYGNGAGGIVTQATSKSTGVTLNVPSGQITMNAAALAGNTTVSFTLTNSSIGVNDLLLLNHVSAGTVGSYLLNAQCTSGSATITVRNITTGSLSQAIVIGFAIVKAAVS